MRSTAATIAGSVLALFVLVAVFGPLLVPYDNVTTRMADRLLPPGSTLSEGGFALLGTDQHGRDVLAQVVAGSRVSLLVAVTVVVVGGFVGLVLGLLAGYYGGWTDTVISRLGDMQLAFPSILLAILLAGVLGPSLTNVIIALAVTRWVIFARVVRGSALTTRNREFVDSARVMGASDVRIMARYILPSCVQPLLVAATVQVGLTMVAEAALSFLGLGVPIDQASWGSTIANGRDYLDSAWWIAAVPGLALTLVVICVGVLGDAARDDSDPAKSSGLGRKPLRRRKAGTPAAGSTAAETTGDSTQAVAR
ncbi:peptide/nickel transport system permease protein [Prauserella shujinwangii]|uniref:Peptide/nickel transport system permease protein n=1 Tax=Prauserella shujinwangii TaxID=1453103 RepID=A0A2T0LTV0_9PSEU|nr:ABC transporter permease [Prauserella shujinwangii]PRX47168.1 peptide/nickel transport system permease protein [Prauserella shujinwangii]